MKKLFKNSTFISDLLFSIFIEVVMIAVCCFMFWSSFMVITDTFMGITFVLRLVGFLCTVGFTVINTYLGYKLVKEEIK